MTEATVIDFAAEREKRSPHLEGVAHCLACGHEHRAIAPIGTHELQCSSCGLMRAVWFGLFVPERGFACECGAFAFALTNDGPMCLRCGLVMADWRRA